MNNKMMNTDPGHVYSLEWPVVGGGSRSMFMATVTRRRLRADHPTGQRSAKDDWRVALHEAGHVIVGRVLGAEIGGVTIVAGSTFSGLTWGPTYTTPAMALSDVDADNPEVSDLSAKIRNLMPMPGESRKEVVDIIAHAHHRVVELMAGTAAETLLHADDPPWEPKSDILQAQSLASLVCSSPSAIDAFLTFGFEEAMALIREHKVLVLAVARALIDHPERTLSGTEIDIIIAQTLANEAQAAKRARHERWKQVEQNAAAFEKQFGE